MKLLLDTHAFLFAIAAPAKLSTRLRELLSNPDIERSVSIVSLWEIIIKVQIGKLPPMVTDDYFDQHLIKLNATLLPLEPKHLRTLAGLPLHHRDPFDRVIVAQSLSEDLVLATKDSNLSSYGAKLLW